MKHFELWVAELPGVKDSVLKSGHRPVVIASDCDRESILVSAVPLTKDRSSLQLPTHVLLCSRYLDHPSRALCEQILTLDKSHLIRRIGYVEDSFDRFALNRALALHLNLPFMQGIYFTEDNLYETSWSL